MIGVLDYGVGNVASIVNMFRAAGCGVRVAREAADVDAATRLVLPGVGHFDHGMRMLNASGLRDALELAVLQERKPVLGICLGAQMLGRTSDEGTEPGLGWLAVRCVRFAPAEDLRVPHMGWAPIRSVRESPLFADLAPDARFYHVHSYYMECLDPADVVAVAEHGVAFTTAVARENVMGVQFHPEKSLRHGMAVLRNFGALDLL